MRRGSSGRGKAYLGREFDLPVLMVIMFSSSGTRIMLFWHVRPYICKGLFVSLSARYLKNAAVSEGVSYSN